MNAFRDFPPNRESRAIIGVVALLTLVLFAGTAVAAVTQAKGVGEQRDQSTVKTGSGERYQTTVERHTEGHLSAQDLHQVSLLSSRVVNHLNAAVRSLQDEDIQAAKPQIESAQKLTKMIREMLPVTTVVTVVKDAGGKEVYRDTDKVQEDRIPLYSGMIATEVVEPIIAAQKRSAELKGLRLADAQVVQTSVLADLSYIERKLNRAMVLLDKPDEALAELALAQAQGIETSVNKVDSPLVTVQHALRLAERMVDEGKYEAAQENLRQARIQLGVYRTLVGSDAAKDVRQLEDDIDAVMSKIKGEGAATKIRGFWERAVSWFRQEPGQAHVVTGDSGGDPNKAATAKK